MYKSDLNKITREGEWRSPDGHLLVSNDDSSTVNVLHVIELLSRMGSWGSLKTQDIAKFISGSPEIEVPIAEDNTIRSTWWSWAGTYNVPSPLCVCALGTERSSKEKCKKEPATNLAIYSGVLLQDTPLHWWHKVCGSG